MLVWLLLLVSGVLGQRDMREKLFAFPKESSTSYVQLLPEKFGPFGEVTVCLRFHSNLTRQYSLFSLSTPGKYNSFVLFYNPGSIHHLRLIVDDELQGNCYCGLQGNNFTEWTSLCVTWNSSTWVVWIDGKNYDNNGTPNVTINAKPSITIGQEQDSYGGRFNVSQSFVGEMTDINMWDKALAEEMIMHYSAGDEISGNVLNWNALNYTLFGDVGIHPYVDPYPCIPE